MKFSIEHQENGEVGYELAVVEVLVDDHLTARQESPAGRYATDRQARRVVVDVCNHSPNGEDVVLKIYQSNGETERYAFALPWKIT